jgi:hypothetical protein
MCGLSSLHRSRDLVAKCFVACPSFSWSSIWGLLLWCWLLVYVECGLYISSSVSWSPHLQTFDSSAAIALCCWCCQASIFGGPFSDSCWWISGFSLWYSQVSAPYSTCSTDFTMALNSLILVLVDRYLDVHTSFSYWKAALAILTLIFTVASVPPCLSTLPR